MTLSGEGRWNAKWIWNKQNQLPNEWVCFRKTFVLQETVISADNMISAAAVISADTKYWLWINGNLAVFEGGLNRGPEPGKGYYDKVAIGDYLVKGCNTIAALAWYWGNAGRNSADSGKGGFLFEGLIGNLSICSDETWKVKTHPAYGPTEEPMPSYLYGGHNIGFDARLDIPGWNTNGFDDSNWEYAAVYGIPPCVPWGWLIERPIPLVRFEDVKPYISIKQCYGKTHNIVTGELPHAAHVSPFLRIDAAAGGLKIDIRTDRYDVNGGPGDNTNSYRGHRTEYVTKHGIQEFESLDWLFGENVVYTLPEGVEIIELGYRETGYDARFAGSFDCSDIFLNRLYEKCKRTLYVCMRDNYMDCPDRERGQWIGDVSSQVPQTFYTLDRKADRLTAKAISDFIKWRDGSVLRGNIPGIHCGELPSQSLNAIGETGMIMTYYMNTGDTGVIYDSYEPARDYLKLWELNADGLVEPRKGDWQWYDHGSHIDGGVLENTWYYNALKTVITMAGIAGNKTDRKWLEDRSDSIHANFDRLFWRGDGYSSGDFYDDRANAMAVLSGLAGNDKWHGIANVLKHVKNSTPYMENYVLEALFIMGYGDVALQRMRDRYNRLVNNENSTLWEDFQVLGTKNHAWSGGPLTIMLKYLAGIDAETPGYDRYHIFPRLFDLSSLSIVVPSVKGDIKADIKKGIEKYTMDIVSPGNATAVIGIPIHAFADCEAEVSEIRINGSLIWVKSSYTGGVSGISYAGCSEGFAKFIVPSGKYTIEAI